MSITQNIENKISNLKNNAEKIKKEAKQGGTNILTTIGAFTVGLVVITNVVTPPTLEVEHKQYDFLNDSYNMVNTDITVKAHPHEEGVEEHTNRPQTADEFATMLYEKYQIQPEYSHTIYGISWEYGVDPRYVATIGLSENLPAPWHVGDNGCSFGAFQGNACAGTGRWHFQIHGRDFKSCMLNDRCATRWTVERITTMYGCNIDHTTGQISNWIWCLSHHNGWGYPQWYADKITKRGLELGLSL